MLTELPRQIIFKNKAKCIYCGSVLVSISTMDIPTCRCGKLYIAGGYKTLRRHCDSVNDFIELSEVTIHYEPLTES